MGVGTTKMNWAYSGSKDETFGNLMMVAVGGGDDGGSSHKNGNIVMKDGTFTIGGYVEGG
ncbi:hypothetical protein F2Q70_00039357 [Brassica cretica]|uniref:Uncharacterized protein n=1 Tax=Brassica cretica TaxID=69181 RepID=A0A8S9KCM4_BRACR|nr:hypothetical protein F2Q70_00039357 [Brassica cretica]KAF3494722.1 hypothetical protein DY000_02053683 [Brassica cretica]